MLNSFYFFTLHLNHFSRFTVVCFVLVPGMWHSIHLTFTVQKCPFNMNSSPVEVYLRAEIRPDPVSKFSQLKSVKGQNFFRAFNCKNYIFSCMFSSCLCFI